MLNREQTEKSYKKSFFQAMKTLVTTTDPLSHFAVNEGNEETVQPNSLTLVSKLVGYISELEKGFSAEGKLLYRRESKDMRPEQNNVINIS